MGTLRHKGMIPWDDDIDVYYFRKDMHKIMDPHGPVHKCLKERNITNSWYIGNGDWDRRARFRHWAQRHKIVNKKKNLRFAVHGKHMLSAFPAYDKGDHIDFVSQNIEKKRSPMLKTDIFPLKKMPFHDYHVNVPHNIEKYLQVDWGHNQVDKIKTPSYESLMSIAISGHLHRGCKRHAVVAKMTDIEFLDYYDPKDFENTLPFRTGKCHGRILTEYEEYYQVRRLVAVGE